MKRALLIATPLFVALFVAGCPFFLEWEDDCGDWGCSDSDDCNAPDPCSGVDCGGSDWTSPPTGTTCVPGSTRYCDTPTYCSWGEQRCNDQGTGWGPCYESSAPPGCGGWSYDEDCCIDSGSCCQDWYDFDGDGDTNDSVGTCEEVRVCDEHSDCPDGYCAMGEDGAGTCLDTGECDEDEDCEAFGPGLACDDRGLCAPEEAPCPSGECGCETDDQCDEGMICIASLCTDADTVCLFDFECGEGARCLDNECHASCEGGCPAGQVCAASVCVDSIAGDGACVFNEDCNDGFLCINATCFRACEDDGECDSGEACRAGACRPDTSPVHSCGEGLGECAADMICHRGTCRLPCMADVNCTGELSVCGEDGFCLHPNELAPQCIRAADCPEGISCLSNRCTDLGLD